jgi:hypothetical protein
MIPSFHKQDWRGDLRGNNHLPAAAWCSSIIGFRFFALRAEKRNRKKSSTAANERD